MPVRATLLILGGTAEAVELATRAQARFGGEGEEGGGLRIVSSLAGRTAQPRLPPGEVRQGGFGGVAGLRDWLRREEVDFLIDATHPFAVRIAAHGAAAVAEVAAGQGGSGSGQGPFYLKLLRPEWQAEAGDRWIQVPDADAAAARLPGMGRVALLTLGRQELALFRPVAGMRIIARMIDAPDAQTLAEVGNSMEFIRGRGPFDPDEEWRLFSAQGIDVLVTRNSGGSAGAGKVQAARRLGLPVLMIDRPRTPQGPSDCVGDVAGALDWLAARLAARLHKQQ